MKRSIPILLTHVCKLWWMARSERHANVARACAHPQLAAFGLMGGHGARSAPSTHAHQLISPAYQCALCLLAVSSGAFSQTATDLNEGSRLISIGNNSYQFTWWARAGVFYLVDTSTDLIHWSYTNELFEGAGGVSRPVVFNNATGDRLFVRLQRDPFNTDSDGDAIPDGWEVLHGLGPRNPNDANAICAAGEMTNLQKYQYGLDPTKLDTDEDGFNDLPEINNGTDPLRPGPTVALTAPSWATLAN